MEPSASPRPSGRWIRLPQNGWGCLIASQAPQGTVQRVAPLPARLVREECTSYGSTVVTHRPPTAAELAMVTEDMREYLEDAGVEPDAWVDAWEIWLPDAVTETAWWHGVHEAQVTPNPRDYVRLLRDVIAELTQ